MKCKIIVATNNNNVIGNKGIIPWICKEDLRHFAKTTKNNIVIMGRVTYESLDKKPLAKRYNIVLTTSKKHPENTDTLFFANNIEQVKCAVDEYIKKNGEKTAYIIGGAMVYETFMSKGLVDEIILTQIFNNLDGDVFFEIPEEWRMTAKKEIAEDATIYHYKKIPHKKRDRKGNII